MEKTEWIKILLKVLIYALGLVATAFGVTALSSCSTSRDISVVGRSTIVTTDTTFVQHNRIFNYAYPK